MNTISTASRGRRRVMLYLDIRGSPARVPNMFGGRENLDAIAFMKRCNEVCYERFPGIATIAEESTSWPGVSRPTYTGGLGFGFKWNMGWMNDSLRYIAKEPIYRRYHQGMITFSMIYAFQEHLSWSLVMMRWSMARARSSRKCRVMLGRSLPTSACSWPGCGPILQEAHFPRYRIRPVEGVEPWPEPGLALDAKSDAQRAASPRRAPQLALCQ